MTLTLELKSVRHTPSKDDARVSNLSGSEVIGGTKRKITGVQTDEDNTKMLIKRMIVLHLNVCWIDL